MTNNPPLNNLANNASTLQKDLQWLALVLETRFALYFNKETPYSSIYDIPAPDLSKSKAIYSDVVKHYQMNTDERLILLLALSPHICPQLLDIFFTKNELYGRGFSEFGGVRGTAHSGFLPTGETVAFILAGNDLTRRFKVMNYFDPDHFLNQQQVVYMEKDRNSEPLFSGVLNVGKEYLSYFTSGEPYKPKFSSEFPAAQISTNLEWDDLVLENHTKVEIDEIHTWLKYNKKIMYDWGMSRMIKPGFRSLFYGPPGTGKSLTASLLGKSTGMDVYRIDLSKVVSKYIGETEKNMAGIFDQAAHKNWILFFDEADALFGKRSATNDSKDRYANQEVAYLLQRVEDFPGVVILASNLRSNIDDAFSRRFQSMIFFPMPKPEQRLKLWKRAFADFELDKDVDLWKIAKTHELAGGAVINVLRYCAIMAVVRGEKKIFEDDIQEGIRKEFKKEGKTL